MSEKADYVLGEARKPMSRKHTCHWPGCDKQCPLAMWGCRTHWFKLPEYLRTKIWRTFKPGQEKTMTPSREYVEAAREVEEWIKANAK